jgi:hypothetical protein
MKQKTIVGGLVLQRLPSKFYIAELASLLEAARMAVESSSE